MRASKHCTQRQIYVECGGRRNGTTAAPAGSAVNTSYNICCSGAMATRCMDAEDCVLSDARKEKKPVRSLH